MYSGQTKFLGNLHALRGLAAFRLGGNKIGPDTDLFLLSRLSNSARKRVVKTKAAPQDIKTPANS